MRTALAAFVACLLGLWLTFEGSLRLEAGFQSRDWPIVPGAVIESRVEGTRAFHPVIVYEYAVDGTVFRDSTALQQPGFGGRRRRKEVAETERAALRRVRTWPCITGRKTPLGRTATGGVLFGVGLCFLLLYLLGRSRLSPETE